MANPCFTSPQRRLVEVISQLSRFMRQEYLGKNDKSVLLKDAQHAHV